MTNRVDTRPDLGIISLSPKDRDALARETQFKQGTCSSRIVRRPKHGSINDDGSDIRPQKLLKPQTLPEIEDVDGIDPKSLIGTGIGSFGEIYREPSIFDGMTAEEERDFIRHATTGE
jgi:hypothetical protein